MPAVTAALIPSSIAIYEAAITRYVLLLGFGELSSNLVASGLPASLISPASTVLFLDGASTLCPIEVTVHTGASNPGLSLLKASLVALINGFITS